MGFRQQGVQLHRFLRSRTLSGKTRESKSRESPSLLCPAPLWYRAPAAFEMQDSKRDQTSLRHISEMFCGKRCLSVLTPTRNPQGFGPFSPSAGTERPLQWGRTALVQGADGDQAERTLPKDTAPWVRTCPGIRPQSSSALHGKHRTAPGRTGSCWSPSWPCTRDQRPKFPPSEERSQSQNPKSSSKPCWENPANSKWGHTCPSSAERTRPRLELPPLWSTLPKGRVLRGHLSPSSSSPHPPACAKSSREANVAHPIMLVLPGKPCYTSSSWVKLKSSTHASSPIC